MIALDEYTIHELTSGDKTKRITDHNGLALEVRPSGNKIFIFRFQWLTKAQTITIGRWPAISLKTARDLAAEYRICLDRGLDPRRQIMASEKEKKGFFEEFLNYLLNDAQEIPMNILLSEITDEFMRKIVEYKMTQTLSYDLRERVKQKTANPKIR